MSNSGPQSTPQTIIYRSEELSIPSISLQTNSEKSIIEDERRLDRIRQSVQIEDNSQVEL